LLGFLDSYYVIGSRIGLEREERRRGNWSLSHTGGFAGSSALARQRGDGVHYAVIFNRQAPLPADYSTGIRELLDRVIDEHIEAWPAQARADRTTREPAAGRYELEGATP
jgi:hypothetical protein